MTQKKEPSQRQLRVAEEIQHVLGRMLIEDNLFINGLKPAYTMITGVKIAPDMSHASVLVRAIPPVDTDEQVSLLNENKGKFRYRLGKSIRLRIVPDFQSLHEADDGRFIGAFEFFNGSRTVKGIQLNPVDLQIFNDSGKSADRFIAVIDSWHDE